MIRFIIGDPFEPELYIRLSDKALGYIVMAVIIWRIYYLIKNHKDETIPDGN